MTFMFTLFYVISIATISSNGNTDRGIRDVTPNQREKSIPGITTQYKRIPETGNDTDIFSLIKLLQDIADRSVTLASDELPIDEDATDEDPKVSADFENSEDVKDEYVQKPQNILRWLPKRHRVKKQSKMDEMEAERAERNKLRARALNAQKAEYVINSMKTNYWTTLYLWGEVARILKERQILDDLRKMIQTVEEEGNERLRETVLNCYRKLKKSMVNAVWDNKKTNNLIIDHVKHPDHDGVRT